MPIGDNSILSKECDILAPCAVGHVSMIIPELFSCEIFLINSSCNKINLMLLEYQRKGGREYFGNKYNKIYWKRSYVWKYSV